MTQLPVPHAATAPSRPRRLLLAVTESDSHAVGNKLLERHLTQQGYEVLNLGVCTPVEEIAAAARDFCPEAIILSSQNGHAFDDLARLPEALHSVDVPAVPIYLGGNLSVGTTKDLDSLKHQFLTLGVQVVEALEHLELRLLAPAPCMEENTDATPTR